MAKRTPPKRAPSAPTGSAGSPGADAADGADELTGWQRRALDRSLVDARKRALDKSNGFVLAAMKLLEETGDLQFTVQEVVDRSKLSLRSFYQTFASKDELLLALFEEYIATAAIWQREQMEREDDPIEQIRIFLTSLWEGKLAPDVVRALARYNLTLASTRPAELERALAPQLEVLLEAVERGVATGQVRGDVSSRRLSEILLHTGTAAVHTTILRTGQESPDDVWAMCLGGIRAPA
jgi:AcrR family transcriptional regulator